MPVDVEAAGDGAGGTPCAPGAAAAGVPEEAAARRAAAAFFADVDLAITPRFTDVLADDWVTWVAGSLPVAGQDTDIFVAVAFGPDAVVTNANAHLARPVEVHGCPTVDADTAVAPLQEQHTWQDWGKVLADPESSGQTEVRTVTLVAAGPQLLQIVDSDRTMWLLPGVRFSDADGGRWQVLTVADEYLVHATHDEPDTPEPAPEPVDTEPEVGPGKLIDETAAPTEQPRPAPAPGEPDPTDAEAIAAYLVGLSETEAVRSD